MRGRDNVVLACDAARKDGAAAASDALTYVAAGRYRRRHRA